MEQKTDTNKLTRSLIEDYYDVQNFRIEVDGQLRAFEQGVSDQASTFVKETVSKKLHTIEADIEKFIERNVLAVDPLYTKWLKGVKGVGPILSAGLFAWIGDIEKFPTISKLWAYCGLSAGYVKLECAKGHKIIASSPKNLCPVFAGGVEEKKLCGAKMEVLETVEGKVPKRQVGWLIYQNSRLKTHMWKIGESFVKTKGGYRKLYDEFRAEYNAKWTSPEICGSIGCKNKKKCLDGHKYAAAKRKTVKVFLAHYWQKARELKGLPKEDVFIIGREGHAHSIPIVEE